MKVVFDKSFYKSLDNLNNPIIARQIEKIITSIQAATSIRQIHQVKKLQGFPNFYRIRIGDYRLGLELQNALTASLIVIANRKDIYKVFP